VEDSIFIQPNGLNYYEFEQPASFKKDTFSVYVSQVIEATLFDQNLYYQKEAVELKQIFNMYQQQFQYTGVGELVEGYVYDATDGLPLPGVTIIVKGTNYGTITDIDGYYSIKVPPGNVALSYSFVGFMPEDRLLGTNTTNVHMNQDINRMEEVVVVGYGVQKKSNITASFSTVTSSSLLGGIPGVSGNISRLLNGKMAGVSVSSFSGTPEGQFQISIRGTSTPLAFEKTPLFIINGQVFTGDISELDPSIIQNMVILKDEEATAIYGSRGANGVVIVETQPGAFKSTQAPFKGADYDETFLEAASQSSSIRANFSDYAFWQPDLLTDKEGKASFEVVFPDDVTSWETYYLAMNGQRQSGQTEGLIKSYKPLMAQLAIPRFLVQSDTSYVIGKVLNYSPDSVKVATKFEMDGKQTLHPSSYISNSLIDTLAIVASKDSMVIKYYLETNEGYFDGEQREIPVFPKGLETTSGDFHVLDRDTTIPLQFDTNMGEVTLLARADILEVLEDEISHLIAYKYSCNEQLASKLKALIAERNIAYYNGERFKKDPEVERIIRLLKRNQKPNGLWGWWKNSEEQLWISLHVLEALSHAELIGYKTSIDKNQVTELLIWELESSRDFHERLSILQILNHLGVQMNYQTYITDLERTKDIHLNGLLKLTHLKQLCKLEIDLDTLDAYKKTTLFGNVFYSDDRPSNLLNNDLQNTLLAYKIFKADSISDKERLGKMRNYFLENRHRGYWRNTYESAQIIEAILPDLLVYPSSTQKPTLTLRGDVNKTVTEFPFEMQLSPAQKISITKTGNYPVYFTSNQKYWNSAPTLKKEDFEITTSFSHGAITTLKAGQETKLMAKVTVKKDAEYVMINVPIPGGCSYSDKKNDLRNEAHREYFKNETTIFCEYLPKGEYTFEIDLISRYAGSYTVNPAKVELMYFPTFNANNEITTTTITIK
jgi:TonB-dependent SusC/RagA subfamily outer membrane receptor